MTANVLVATSERVPGIEANGPSMEWKNVGTIQASCEKEL